MERKVVVGLGNPGPEYRETRHNAGFLVAHGLVDRMKARPLENTRTYEAWIAGLDDARELVVLTPLTFMNASGQALLDYGARHAVTPDALLVVVDDVYLPLGQIRLRAQGGDGGHNGLTSLTESLGTDAFARLRIGVGRGDEEQVLKDHVLSGFAPEETAELTGMLDRACEASLAWAREGIVFAMNRFNARPRAARENAPEGER
jgi:PTH1 family peptidyl-tRNA hydrolase